MGVNKNVSPLGHYFQLLKKSSAVTHFGYEWEIPFHPNAAESVADEWTEYESFEATEYAECEGDEGDFIYDYCYGYKNSPFMKRWLQELGYKSHIECGGLEIDSPVFNDLGMARAHIKHMIAEARKTGYFCMDGNEFPMNDCGIHVHVSDPLLENHQVEGISHLASLMWNREENGDLVWKLTEREDSASYEHQGRVSAWDSYSNTNFEEAGDLIQTNAPGNVSTMEMRMFSCGSHLLIPAVECAHSTFKFTKKWVQDKRMSSRMIFDMLDAPVSVIDRLVPRYADYNAWLNRQRGYNSIKQRLEMVA